MTEDRQKVPMPRSWGPDVDDVMLVARMQQNDRSAFRLFYKRYARYVAGVVYRILGSDEDLDDLVQETFLEALRSLQGIKEPERVRHWIARIAVRQVSRVLDRRTKRRKLASTMRSFFPESGSGDRDFALAVYWALDELPADDRVAWVLHRIEGETIPDTSLILGVSNATTKRRIARADEFVRRRLGHER